VLLHTLAQGSGGVKEEDFASIEAAMTLRSRLPESEHVCMMRMLNDMQREIATLRMPVFAPVVIVE
jgi:hypothetical protein